MDPGDRAAKTGMTAAARRMPSRRAFDQATRRRFVCRGTRSDCGSWWPGAATICYSDEPREGVRCATTATVKVIVADHATAVGDDRSREAQQRSDAGGPGSGGSGADTRFSNSRFHRSLAGGGGGGETAFRELLLEAAKTVS